jgi:hypothetical protein
VSSDNAAIDLDSTYANFKILTPYPGTPQFKQLKPLIVETDWEKFDGYTLNFRHPALTPRRARLMLGIAYSRYFFRPSQKSKRLKSWYPKIQKFVLLHATIAVLLSRFAAGFRITIPIICATAGMPAKKYSVLNLISGFLWASFWVAVMYQVGARVHPG